METLYQTNGLLTVGPWVDVKIGFTRKIIIALKVRGGNGELKFSEGILLRCLSAEIWAVMTQNWENWEITQSGWLDPLYHYMYDMKSICCEISIFCQICPKTHWKWAEYVKTKMN